MAEVTTVLIKKIISILMVIGMASMATPVFAENSMGITNDEVKVIIDGKRINFDVPPVIHADRALVPMRKIFEIFGYSVDWNADRQRIIASKDNSIIQLDIGDTVAILGDYDATHFLDVPPLIINDRTMVPLRFVASVANYDVIWESETKTVFIETIFDGDITPRPNQAIAMFDDSMIWTNGWQISYNGYIFDEADFANSDTLQVYKKYIYYCDTDLNLCRINKDTNKSETLTNFPVTNILVFEDRLYYSKPRDTVQRLFRANLDASEETCVVFEPCGDYRIWNNKVIYMNLVNKNLKQTNMITGEIKTIYEGMTTCFDVHQSTLYYSIGEMPKGIKMYNLEKESHEKRALHEGIAIENIWRLGDNIFYQVLNETGTYDMYRNSLVYKYNVKILNDISEGVEIHGNHIFYHPTEDDYFGGIYIANTRGSNRFPVKELIFYRIVIHGLEMNKPDDDVFDEYLKRDISTFVSEEYGTENFDYFLLTKDAELDMNGGCGYYVWLNIYSEEVLVESGVLGLTAKDKEVFIHRRLQTKAYIASNEKSINSFPIVIRKRVLELVE